MVIAVPQSSQNDDDTIKLSKKEEEPKEKIIAAIREHPNYAGKTLGLLPLRLKSPTKRRDFRDQCASTTYAKPNALAQYAVSQVE